MMQYIMHNICWKADELPASQRTEQKIIEKNVKNYEHKNLKKTVSESVKAVIMKVLWNSC